MIKSCGKNIWFVRAPLVLGGINLSSQMTLIKTSHKQIVLISPVKIDEALKLEIDTLGKVAWIIAPNNFHHLFLNSAKRAFPDAQVRCPEGLPKKIKNLPEHGILDVNETAVWGDDLEVLRIYNGGMSDEHVFYHGSSQTLVLTDLFMWFEQKRNLATRLFTALVGVNSNSPKMSRLMKFVYRDKAMLKESFKSILMWDFQRVHLAHSRNIDTDAKQHVQHAMAAILPASDVVNPPEQQTG